MRGPSAGSDWLAVDDVLRLFGSTREHAHGEYARFVDEGIDGPSVLRDLRQEIYLGSEDFIDRSRRRIGEAGDLGEVHPHNSRTHPGMLERVPTIDNAHAEEMMRTVGLALATVGTLLAGSAAGVTAEAARPRHLIYLHGRIVQEQQSARPRHPQFGYYELDQILDAFRHRGFVVSGEIRPKSDSVSQSADRVVHQVRQLLDSGVAADRITVVGGSIGGAIALLASARLQIPDLRFSVLGVCLSAGVRDLLANEGKGPSGHLLSIREARDEIVGPCTSWRNELDSRSPLVVREIVLKTGLRHGFLYRPLPEWVNPIVEWAEAR